MNERLGLSLAAGCTSAALLYSILRIGQVWLLPEPDPALVFWSDHSGFFWRAWTCAYAAGTVAFAVSMLEREKVARALARAVVPVAVVVALQAAFVP